MKSRERENEKKRKGREEQCKMSIHATSASIVSPLFVFGMAFLKCCEVHVNFVRMERHAHTSNNNNEKNWNSCSSSASQRQFKRVQINRWTKQKKKNVEIVKTWIGVRVAERNANEMPNIQDELRRNYDNSNKYRFVSSVAAVSLLCIVICCFINNFNCAPIVWTAYTNQSQRRLVRTSTISCILLLLFVQT